MISAHLDGELSDARLRGLQDHLMGCEACTAFAMDAARLSESLESLTAPEPRGGFAGRLMARLPEQSPQVGASIGWLDLLRPAPLGLGAVAFFLGVMLPVLANGETSTAGQSALQGVEAIAGDYFETISEVSVNEQLLVLVRDTED